MTTTSGSGLRVLVIDDSNTIRRSAEIFLKQGGHEVVLAEDGFDALGKINDFAPNLIFCDILMPRLDGYQTCSIIRRNEKFSGVPVISIQPVVYMDTAQYTEFAKKTFTAERATMERLGLLAK